MFLHIFLTLHSTYICLQINSGLKNQRERWSRNRVGLSSKIIIIGLTRAGNPNAVMPCSINEHFQNARAYLRCKSSRTILGPRTTVEKQWLSPQATKLFATSDTRGWFPHS